MMKWLVKRASFLILYLIIYVPCSFLGMKWYLAVLIGVAAVLWMVVCLIYWTLLIDKED